MQEVFAVALFAVVLLLIALELVNRTVAALLGAAILISFGIVHQEEAATEFIDWNTIGLLAGMMVIVAILENTGVFEYLAIKSAQWGKARPGRILILLAVVTAFLSAFLDNVTTVILMVPVTFLIADALESSPTPFLLTQVMASNIGGAATLIGDPPNILIGSAADLDFGAFLLVMAPLSIILLAIYLVAARWLFRGLLVADPELQASLLDLDERSMITHPGLLRSSLTVLGLTLVGFLFHGLLHLEPATVALTGAVVLMIIAREDPDEILRDVEWPTLFFFIGLFMLVAGVIEIGLIEAVATGIEQLTGGALAATSLLML